LALRPAVPACNLFPSLLRHNVRRGARAFVQSAISKRSFDFESDGPLAGERHTVAFG
jgi:hypothetical protein